MRHFRRLLAALIGLLAAVAVAAPAPARPAAAGPPAVIPPVRYCDVRVTVQAQWVNGYVVAVTVTNISAVPVTWYATLTLQPPGYIVQVWNASVTTSGTSVRIWPPWNPVLLPGQSVSFGYTGSGQLALPTVICQPVTG